MAVLEAAAAERCAQEELSRRQHELEAEERRLQSELFQAQEQKKVGAPAVLERVELPCGSRWHPKGVFHLPCEPTRSTLNIICSCGLFEGMGVSTSRVSPPGPLSISYGHVGCLKASAFPSSV